MKLFNSLTLAFALLVPFGLPAPQDKVWPPVKPPQHTTSTGYVQPTPEKRAAFQKLSKARHGDRIARAAMFMALPAKYDAREKVPIPMGDQGSCGSCYLYATVWYSFTDAGIRAGYGKADSYRLSVQWGMDRPRDFGGCNGGWGQEVAEYICNKGLIAEMWVDASGTVQKDYPPYQASSGSDRTKSGAKVWAKGWTWGLVSNDNNPSIEEIKTAMLMYGRLNIALDAGGQFGSGTGTITQLGRSINHEISVCGWDDTKDGGCFLLENQWGTNWGNGGYRWITYAASKNITDWFWVSAGVVPPPPPPPPPDDGKPPFKLYVGKVPELVQVGPTEGYGTLPLARTAAQAHAAKQETAVHIYDATPKLIETIQPGPLPPPPPIPGTVTITLTTAQVQSILDQAGAMVITPTMTVQQIIDQLKARAQKLRE